MAQAYGENLKQALDTLRTHKLRSLLTVFGVVLGVGVIMMVAALIHGFDMIIQDNITQWGADTAFISRWDQGPHSGRRPKEERERKPLTREDGIAVIVSLHQVEFARRFADRVIGLADGCVLFDGKPGQLGSADFAKTYETEASEVAEAAE